MPSQHQEVPQNDPQNDLKAQEDLLALKVLGDPDFLDRVPYLMPIQNAPGGFALHPDLSSEELMQALSEEVKVKVLAELELILPELISSCWAEVLAQHPPHP